MTITRRTSLRLAVAGLGLLAAGGIARGGAVNTNGTAYAIQGYDPVAYFTEGRAVEGLDAFTAFHDGATWRFASAVNRDAFLADPAGYAPQYGGFCAFAVAHNATAPIDPNAFSVRGGKLYLNYTDFVRSEWRKDPEGFISRADANWPGLSGD